MKRILLILTLLSADIISTAQTSPELDSKNGFLEFKFGTPPTDYTGKLQKGAGKEVVSGNQTYTVTAPNYKRVLGYDVNKINLSFAKNKLWAITIDFIEEYEDTAYDFILYKLKNIFGDSFAELNSKDVQYFKYLKGEHWKGKKTTLDIIKVKIKDSGKYYVSIYYLHKELEKEVNTAEF